MTILKQLVELMREGLGVQNSRGETVLHTALTAVVQKEDIAARIVASYLVNSMRAEDLEIKDKEGYTALGRLLNGSNHESVLRELVESMIKKNSKLLTIGSPPYNHIPVVEASAWSRWSLCHYLYALTREGTLLSGKEVESMNGSQGAQLLNMCIRHPKGHDISCDLLRYRPRLAFVENGFGSYPMLVLARLHFAFLSGKRLTFWQKWIYDCMYIQPADFGTELEDDEDNLVNQIFSKMLVLGRLLYILLRRLINTFLKLLGYNHLFEMKRIHVQVLNCMSNVTRNREGLTPVEQNIVTDSVLKAIEHGHTEFVIHMCKAYPELVDTNIDQKSRDIFQHAIECRQGEIYSLIYGLKKERRNEIAHYAVDLRNSLLHIAANYSSLTRSNQDASLQMQRELQWFKEVESIVPFETHEYLNSSNGLTARELFTKNHAELKKEAEESMKGTATSCTTVCALIVTIMFAVAFTVPGGTDSATGLPMFMHKKLFRVFILSDTISLVSSATSVITFLGLLTSTYAEDDFLWSLPKKMMIGLSTLFISIAAMMITFSCALTIMLDGEAKMIIPVIMFASVPVVSFAFYLFPLLFEICRSTYGPSMFPKKAGV